ncbi:hypothetical protein ACXO9E_05035 [Lactobacillus delbrueckii subsp. bulgaricus]|nr:hypothetical protein [Lactobacillus delbrueckii subsp. bulgaricus]
MIAKKTRKKPAKKSTKKKTTKKAIKKKSTARKPKKITKKKATVKRKKRKEPPKGTTRKNRIRSSKFGVYITEQQSGKTVQIPVNPESLSFTRESDDTSQKVIKLGEVNQLGLRKLTSIQIDSFLPKYKAPYTVGEWHEPQYYIDFFNDLQKGKKKVRVTVTSTEITFLMTVSSFKHGFDKGYADDPTYSIVFKQYVPFSYTKIKKRKKPRGKSVTKKSKKKRSSKAGKITRGTTVIVTGTVYHKSTGGGKSKRLKKAKRRITLVSVGKKYPYRIREGWVAKKSVKKA